MLCTLTRPGSGHAAVAGFDVARQPKAVRRRIGLVFQEPTLDDRLTGEQNLRFHAVLYHVPAAEVEQRIGRVLRLVALEDRRHDLVSTFSGGMARRLEIARGMLHTPAVLFLDEPTVGLDPQTRALVWEDVLRLRREEQVTIFLTTHYMDEAEYADRLAIIDHGLIVATGTPDELKRQVGADTVELITADNGAAAARLEAAGFRVRCGEEELVVFAEDGEAQVPRLIETAGVRVRSVHVHRPTLGMSTLVGSVAGFDFKKFLFPGIVAMTVMSTAISSAISIVWDREFGFLHEMLVARSAAPHWYSARPSAGPASPPSRAPSCPTNGGRAHGQAPGNQEQPMVRQGSGTGPAAPAPGHGRGDDRGADHRGGRTCSAGYGCTRPTSSSSCWAP